MTKREKRVRDKALSVQLAIIQLRTYGLDHQDRVPQALRAQIDAALETLIDEIELGDLADEPDGPLEIPL